ncbi:MAG: ABC-F family ATP-binding cassette domain-containing protein [Tissierellia bacterium]|nr:ABC-F family ATP-binding cassette domain-containing protein [Tissierellia bacterium]
MKLLQIRNATIGFPLKTLMEIPQLDVETGEKIGLIGVNGSGKSTLLKVLTGEMEALEGSVQSFGNWVMLSQFGEANRQEMTGKQKSLWGISALEDREEEVLSGGEKTRQKLAEAFSQGAHVYLFDEPTSHLDQKGIEELRDGLSNLSTFILISHDRMLLDELTNRTWDIREGKLFDYPGPYGDYVDWLEKDLERREKEYEEYEAEKKRLGDVARQKREQAARTQRKPKGKSPSEWKAAEFGSVGKSLRGKAKSLQSAAKHVEKRIEQMEVKEKPKRSFVINPDFSLTNPPQNRIIAEATDFSFAYGKDKQHLIFDDTSFYLKRNHKTALVGANGTGKSTLLRLISNGHQGIHVVPKAKIGFFRQELENIDPEETVLENLQRVSCQDEAVSRSLLARMGFFQQDIWKKGKLLSGGERVKLSFTMLFVSDCNVLLLDEPTNFLDIPSIEAIEELLHQYEGTVLFTSHDRRLVEKIADEIWKIEDKKISILETGV